MKKVVKVGSESASIIAVNQDSTTALLIEQWIKESDVQPLTQRSYRTAAKTFVSWLEENGKELTEGTLIEYREYLKKNRATTTARLYFGLAKQFTGWLAKRGYIQRNCAFGVKTVKLPNDKHNRDALPVEGIAACLAQFDRSTLLGKRNAAIFMTMAACGLRCIEVVRLKRGWIEKRGGNYTLKIWGKNRSGAVDTIILPVEVKAAIDEYLEARAKKYGRINPSEPLFASVSNNNCGKELQTQSISKMVKATMIAAGYESSRLTAHSLRHANATIALDSGVDIDDVALNLRHLGGTAVTQKYRHDAKILHNKTNTIVAGVILKALGEFLKGEKKNEG